MLDKLRHHAKSAASHTDDVDEHRAFVELLVAAMFADHRVSLKELNAIETFDESHPDWDTTKTSMDEHFGEAAAKVRSAQAAGTLPALITDVAERLRTPELRAGALAACSEFLSQDGTTDDERKFLSIVSAALR